MKRESRPPLVWFELLRNLAVLSVFLILSSIRFLSGPADNMALLPPCLVSPLAESSHGRTDRTRRGFKCLVVMAVGRPAIP